MVVIVFINFTNYEKDIFYYNGVLPNYKYNY